jgi:kynurenine formamidase
MSYIGMSLHCGTHMDAPYHFFGEGRAIDHVPLEHCMGPALLVRTNTLDIQRAHLEPREAEMRELRRVIFNTGWHRRWGEADYFGEHPVISEDAAQYLTECGVVLVGIDTPSVDRVPYATHLELLGKDVLIIENLTNLDRIAGDRFTLVAFPLKIAGRDGSPVRAIAFE